MTELYTREMLEHLSFDQVIELALVMQKTIYDQQAAVKKFQADIINEMKQILFSKWDSGIMNILNLKIKQVGICPKCDFPIIAGTDIKIDGIRYHGHCIDL